MFDKNMRLILSVGMLLCMMPGVYANTSDVYKESTDLFYKRQYKAAAQKIEAALKVEGISIADKIRLSGLLGYNYAHRLRNPTYAISIYDRYIEEGLSSDIEEDRAVAASYSATVADLMSRYGDNAGAIERLNTLLKNDDPAVAKHRGVYRVRLAEAYLYTGDDVKAMQEALGLLKSGEVGLHITSFISIVRSSFSRAPVDSPIWDDVDAMRHDIRSQMVATYSNPTVRERIHILLTELLVTVGRYDEALSEARLLFELAANETSLKLTAGTVAQCFKAADGNLVRANAFFAFQQHGKAGPDQKLGTNDDIRNPLMDVPYPSGTTSSGDHEAVFKGVPKNWNGRLTRSLIYRLLGQPDKALEELRIAYALCPVKQDALQKVTDQIVDLLIQISGDPEIGQRYVEYQKYGDFGKDGKKDTDDDLTDPMAAYLPKAQ